MDKEKELRPRSIEPFPAAKGFSCRKGMSGDLVMIIQIMLGEVRIFHDYIPHLPVSGKYCPATAHAVSEFQQGCGLPQTGDVDITTWNRLAEEYDMAMRT